MPFSIEKNARKFPRGVILAIATFLTLGNGLIYMWSIFNVPLMETFGYTASGVALAYSLFYADELRRQLFERLAAAAYGTALCGPDSGYHFFVGLVTLGFC